MANVWTLFKRQLRSYAHVPLFYVLMVGFLLVAGLGFCGTLTRNLGGQIAAGDLLFGAPSFWAAVLGVVTLLSMPTLAEERRSGTLEALLTAPVTDVQVVLGKYGGACAAFVLLTAPTAAYWLILKAMAPGMADLDLVPVATGFLILWLIGGCFLAVGVLVSALARSPMEAGAITMLVIGAAFYLPEALRPILTGPTAQAVLDYLDSGPHIREFARGTVDTRPIVLYLSGTAGCLFAAVKALESRQWR